MKLAEELTSKSAPRIKKAAAKVAKEGIDGYESLLLAALPALIERPRSWKVQSEVIKALGITGSEKSLSYLKELSAREFESTVLYRDMGFSICLLEDIPRGQLNYAVSILETENDSLLAGVCSAILFSEYTPDPREITQIINAVIDREEHEGQVITPRCYIAAACYSWPPELTTGFLNKCTSSRWPGLVEIARDSLKGKKTKYILV